MARAVKEMAGKVFGKWTVLRRAGSKNRQATWLCRCSCGTKREIRGGTLRQGLSQSCGECLDRSALRAVHGFGGTKIYDIWRQMCQRCINPDHRDFKHYGGRGISVCERWQDITLFVEDMGENREGLSLSLSIGST